MAYTYTYDAGDNMITKVEPWADDFGDGNATDEWLSSGGTWSVVNGAAQNVTNASVYPELQLAATDDDSELRYTYTFDSVQSGSPWIETVMRWEVSTAKQLTVDFYADRAEIWKYDGAAWTRLAQNLDVDSATGTTFNVRVELDGARSPARCGFIPLRSTARR